MARFWAFSGLAAIGCGAAVVAGSNPEWSAPPRGPTTVAAAPPRKAAPAPREQAASTGFETLRRSYEDLTYAGLVDKLGLRRAPDAPPGFDPTAVDHYDRVRTALQLSAEEQAIYQRTGLAGVDHGQRYSMASAYLAIYKRDLPVLITTDSMLHALHRSFDALLVEMELEHFVPEMRGVLRRAHEQVAALRQEASPALRDSARDVDLYLTVALSLLEPDARPPVGSALDQEDRVREVIEAVASLRPDDHFPIYGGRRAVDWSQFRPRGHYTLTPQLQHYFQAMMWLGRVDLGFALTLPAPVAGNRTSFGREQRDAALLGLLLARSGQLEALARVDQAIRFFVGASDSAGPAQLAAALSRAGVREPGDLASTAAVGRVMAELGAAGGGAQQIRSQLVDSDPGNAAQTPLHDVFQVFGQRFVIDSFVLSKVVFDAIVFKGEKQARLMPSGLDVIAALGNDEAVALLRPDLERDNYAANLLASRALVERQRPETWNASVYNIWLSALSKLDDVPAGTSFPEVMRGRAWQAKQLQTQLGSWAELRHDTILYAKQSYTAHIACEYPTGYVEPYPEVFARLAVFAEQSQSWLAAGGYANARRDAFFHRFAAAARTLERLARKELAAQPFDRDERTFIKDTISVTWHGGGCGGPTATYSGWYPGIIYGGEANAWQPTIADVHTDPNSGKVLETAVGDANFLVVAIDNAGDRAAYVGPIYSYYEFTSPQRLTDEEWRERIWKKDLPPRPEWTRIFQAPTVVRAPISLR